MAREPHPGPIAFESVAFRYSNYDTPFWVRPNTEPGRWHLPGDGPTQYLCSTVEGAWAELIRAEGLSSEAEVALVRMPIWVTEVNLQKIADYGTFEKAEEAGFPFDALVEEHYGRCQAEGKRLRDAGYQGVLAPSAALTDALNLTLFGPRIASSWGTKALLSSSIPATKIAVGSPPEGIVDRVRQVGQQHRALQRFEAGRGHRQKPEGP